jgi:poly(A) polymerase
LKAADFMKRGVAQGPALGTALAAAERAWIAAGFTQERRALDDIADAAAKSAASS